MSEKSNPQEVISFEKGKRELLKGYIEDYVKRRLPWNSALEIKQEDDKLTIVTDHRTYEKLKGKDIKDFIPEDKQKKLERAFQDFEIEFIDTPELGTVADLTEAARQALEDKFVYITGYRDLGGDRSNFEIKLEGYDLDEADPDKINRLKKKTRRTLSNLGLTRGINHKIFFKN